MMMIDSIMYDGQDKVYTSPLCYCDCIGLQAQHPNGIKDEREKVNSNCAWGLVRVRSLIFYFVKSLCGKITRALKSHVGSYFLSTRSDYPHNETEVRFFPYGPSSPLQQDRHVPYAKIDVHQPKNDVFSATGSHSGSQKNEVKMRQ